MQPAQQPQAQPQIQPQAVPMQQAAQPQIQGQVIPMQPMQNMQGFPTTNAMLALILGCVSLVFGGVCLAIPALIIANGALKITSQYPGHPDQSNANIARIISIISIIIYSIFIVIFICLHSLHQHQHTDDLDFHSWFQMAQPDSAFANL